MGETPRPMIVHEGRPKQSQEFSDVLAREMALTAETLGVQLTELMVAGYAEALAGMTPKIMSLGFRRARKKSRFFPKPIEVREWGYEEWELIRPRFQGLPAPPEPTAEQREADKKLWEETMSKLGPSKK